MKKEIDQKMWQPKLAILDRKNKEDPFNGLSQEEPENEVTSFQDVVLHRSVLSDLPLLVTSIIIGVVAVGLAIFLSDSIFHPFQSGPSIVFTSTLMIGFVIICAVIVFRRYNVRYLIAKDGVMALRGILSNSQVDAKLEYYQIRGTEIHRSFFERLVGTGDLHVRGSTGSDTKVSFKGIYDPYRYQKLIQDRHRVEIRNLKALQIDDIEDSDLADSRVN